jgi:hypothetical protein
MKRLWSVPAVASMCSSHKQRWPRPNLPIAKVTTSQSESMASFIIASQPIRISPEWAQVFRSTSLLSCNWKPRWKGIFSQVFTENFLNGVTTAFQVTSEHRLNGLLGPKVETNGGPLRFFLTTQGGGTTFGFSPPAVTFATFFSSVNNSRTRDMITEYPCASTEVFIGPIGLRGCGRRDVFRKQLV